MKVQFTKMQGAGNDFVVLDETKVQYNLTKKQYEFLANRQFGIGADQILTVRPAPHTDVDFAYIIHNADGTEVEHCGNGARCFVRFIQHMGLKNSCSSSATSINTFIKVQTMNRVLTLYVMPDGNVKVDMGVAVASAQSVGFLDELKNESENIGLDVDDHLIGDHSWMESLFFVSMGNPHAIMVVSDVVGFDVSRIGKYVSTHRKFRNGINAGFVQIKSRTKIQLRVFERGSGETLACGTGACAAVVACITQGHLDATQPIEVQALGGKLLVEWGGHPEDVVWLSGPADIVYTGEIELN